MNPKSIVALGLLALGFLGGCSSRESSPKGDNSDPITLLNVSYDPTRELYVEFNEAFARHWKDQTGQDVLIDQSHGGSGKQARAVNEGLDADIVSLALAGDIDLIARSSKRLEQDWQTKLPHNSSPYTSTIVFLVRKGNPKQIRDWDDLIRDGVEVITPNPKTGGGARWNYLAAWGFALQKELGDLSLLQDPSKANVVEAANGKAKEFIGKLYKNVPVLDTAARAATNTFLQRKIGDVLIAWENEAFLALKESGRGEVEIVVPSLSILAEPPVAVVTKNAEKRGTVEVAAAYLEYLYSDEGQRLAAKHYYRPRNAEVLTEETKKNFADLKLFGLKDLVRDWEEAQEIHFKDRSGIFDQVFNQ
ncbi:sulfate ABC transporter substrate-binding protein [Pirellula sp. SH-Sr6A]|uniref:sulfate ABC transporter substrate-binding protein n=1 Tax=Pirellula sp. SH-Sr6A TaxID=1632865 RepID=UPI0011BAA7F6|nr:sulfate ABC transporter substrate-binding protein [Pirellula sp. SH-Sr6A]